MILVFCGQLSGLAITGATAKGFSQGGGQIGDMKAASSAVRPEGNGPVVFRNTVVICKDS